MNEKVSVMINLTVPITVMKEPSVELRINKLFDKFDSDFKKRYEEIKNFILQHRTDDVFKSETFSYDNVMFYFKNCFYKVIMNEAPTLSFDGKGGYNVLSNVIHLLTEDKFKEAIYGQIMIDAFNKIIRTVTFGSMLDPCLRSSLVMLLEKEFLGKKPPYVFKPLD